MREAGVKGSTRKDEYACPQEASNGRRPSPFQGVSQHNIHERGGEKRGGGVGEGRARRKGQNVRGEVERS